mmetsp:Transcript_60627/g.100676  ORF Transcript_60627/g.100676 Transcript_60627/m.100676 type:complete len:130 (-) Transcript_60627:966-1355(-)
MHNIYLHKEKFLDDDEILFNALSSQFNFKPVNRQELEAILARKQNYSCNIYKELISITLDKLEIDHKPSIYLIKKIAMTDILNNISKRLYKKVFIGVTDYEIPEVGKFLKEYDINDYFNRKILNKKNSS